ncbi:MAG: hypothetical protein AAF633_21965, partial [Chloroflexota bacterium]
MIHPFLNRQTLLKADTVLRFTRRLPADLLGNILVQPGESVSPVQIVVESPEETGFSIFPVADLLRVRPDQLSKYLLVEPGDTIKLGMAVAEKKGMFGFKNQVESTVGGDLIDIHGGNLLIRQTQSTFKLRSLVSGQILYTLFDQGAVIECAGSMFQGTWSNGLEGYGKLKVVEDEVSSLDETQLTFTLGDIVAVNRLETTAKLEALV